MGAGEGVDQAVRGAARDGGRSEHARQRYPPRADEVRRRRAASRRRRATGRADAPAPRPSSAAARRPSRASSPSSARRRRAARAARRRRRGDAELAADVRDLLRRVGHLALRRVVARRARAPSTYGRPSARGEPRGEVGHERRPSGATGTAVTHARRAGRAASGRAGRRTPARARRRSGRRARPCRTSPSQPPSPARASARPSSSWSSGAIFLPGWSAVRGVWRRTVSTIGCERTSA